MAAALGIVGVVLLVMVLAAAKRARGRRARPASRTPRLEIAGQRRPGDAVSAGRGSPGPDSPVGSPRSRATTPRAASGSPAVPPFPPSEARPRRRTGPADRRGPEPLPAGTVAATARVGRRDRRIAHAAMGLVAAIGASVLVGRDAGLLLLAATGGALVIRRAAARRAASRLRAEQAAAAPAVIDLLGACLLAGLNPYRSLVRVAERSPAALRVELARAAVELDTGRTPAAALRAVGERTSLDELRATAAALEAAERWGAPPAEALAARAEALRSRARLRAEAEAGRAAVRLAFPLVFCFLPAFVLLVVVPTMAGALRVLTP